MTETVSTTRTERATRRLKQRYRAERRFKLYGQISIAIALGFLALLVVSIGSQAISAFSNHKVSFDLTLAPETVAPNGPGDTEAIAENVSGFYELVREDLLEAFPAASQSRALETELYGLVTRLATIPMARQTADNPGRLGETVTYRAVLSDDLDLYLKGAVMDEQRMRLSAVAAIDPLEASPAGATRFALTTEASLQQLITALEDAGAQDRGLSTLVQAGPAVAKLEDVTPGRLTAQLYAGRAEDFRGAVPTVRILGLPETERNMTDHQIAWTLSLKDQGRIQRGLNWALLTNADSTYPEIAGVLAAIVGSVFTMLVTASIAIPVGVGAAIYLEEFAPKSRLTGIIEVNINNLAAVPSIVFGLLGAAVFLNVFGFPRSAPLVGGLVLGLLTLPTIIIASRAALRAVPPSIRDAALGVGASRTQAVFHHVLPLAAPGILTGAIIGMARALGETAPLLLIGMVAFVAEVPAGPADEATALPVLVFKWSTGAERAWEPNTAAAIVVLLTFMVMMNAVAVLLRRRFERRW
ncbi:MAG: phosphate ABC transporter permease PstA [Pseudomonadota bacterium]